MQRPNLPAQDVQAARRLAESNATTNHFLGVSRRPWMTNSVPLPSLPANRHVPQSRTAGGTTVTSNVPTPGASQTVESDLEAQLQGQPAERSQPAPSHGTPAITDCRMVDHGGNHAGRKRSLDVAGPGNEPRRRLSFQQTGSPGIPSQEPSAEAARTAGALLDGRLSGVNQLQMLNISAIHSLNRFRARIGTLSTIESQRFSLLREACAQNDPFYLCIHQIFCVVFIKPQQTIDIGFGEAQYAGLCLLTLILLSNRELSAEVLHFFADLPAPFEMLIKERIVYRSLVLRVGVFLQRFAAGWDLLRAKCLARKFPPFVDELVDVFEVHSPVLQRVLFNSIHRQLGGAQNASLSRQSLALFDGNQSQYQVRKRMHGSAEVRPRSAILAEQKLLGEQYRALWRQANDVTDQNSPTAHLLTFGQSMPPPLYYMTQDQGASGTILSRRASASMPHPTLSRSQSTDNFRVNTEIAYGDIGGATSASGVHQMSTPMNAPNLVLQSSPETGENSPSCLPSHMGRQSQPQRRRARPPLSNTPVIPHTSASVAPHGGHRGGPSRADQWNTHAPRFIPAAGYDPIQASTPDPNRLALHQAYLRSPAVVKINTVGQSVADMRLYQYLESFAIPPKAIDQETSLLSWNFSTSASEMSKKAVNTIASGGQTQRLLSDGRLLYRLRSVEIPHTLRTIDASEWSVKDVSWPSCCFVKINDVDIEVRRKHHHGKDLPVDLTPHICEGDNSITIALLCGEQEKKVKRYAMAVEIVEVGDQTRVDSAPTPLAAGESLRSITQALTKSYGGTANDDDEVEVVDSHISIDLFDPFMARIFDIPVRGKACTHRECFDLQTFFQTRKSRVKGEPTSPDEWKCPICKKDARPQCLIVDCFLQTVRDVLVTSGAAADARAILISSDGSWNVKRDGGDAIRTREDSNVTVVDTPTTSKGAVTEAAHSGESVVIEIDDD